MKTKIFLLFLSLITMTLTAQNVVDLSNINNNTTLGQNCSANQTPDFYETTGDLNLNGYNLHLKNITLKVHGYINGPGSITVCGQSLLCTTNSVQNSPQIPSGVLTNCNTLSVKHFDNIYELPKDLTYKIYSLSGQIINEGKTGSEIDFPKHIPFVFKVEGYQAMKMILFK